MTTLSERIASGENTPELREAIAVLVGWRKAGRRDRLQYPNYYGWIGPLPDAYLAEDAPDYLADIRLIIADAYRKGLDFEFSSNQRYVTAWIKGDSQIERKDRDLARCACEALVKALESE